MRKIFNEDCLQGMQRIADKSIDLILCDLPYGTTANKWDKVLDLTLLKEQYLRVIKDNGAIVLFAAQPFATDLINTFRNIFRYDIVWNKINTVGHLNASKMPLRAHELILVFYKKLPTYNPQKTYTGRTYHSNKKKQAGICQNGNNYGHSKGVDNAVKNANYNYPTSISEHRKDAFVFHPTQKPITLLEHLIKTYTTEGDTVLDSCMGAGSTAIACLSTNRNFIGFELEKPYFVIAEKRILEITDKEFYAILYA